MNCKKCGQDLTGKDHKKVAEWAFCPDCFAALLDDADKKKTTPSVDTDAVNTAPVETAGATQQCQVCHTPIEKGDGRRMLGLLFCRPCYDTLVHRPVLNPREERDEPEAKPAVAQVRVSLNAAVACQGCGRQIKAIGSKQVDGKSYCPDCFYALPPAVPEDAETVPIPATETPPGERRCQACSRVVSPETLKNINGFDICAACRSTDPDAALAIARTRHRLALKQIKKDLNL